MQRKHRVTMHLALTALRASWFFLSHSDPQGDTRGGLRAEVTSCLSALGTWQHQHSATGQLRGHREAFSRGRNFHRHGHHSHSDQEDWAFQVSPTSRNRKQTARHLKISCSETAFSTSRAHVSQAVITLLSSRTPFPEGGLLQASSLGATHGRHHSALWDG